MTHPKGGSYVFFLWNLKLLGVLKVFSYQDKHNGILVFAEKCHLCPPTSKNVPDSFVDNSNPIKIGRYGIDWQ